MVPIPCGKSPEIGRKASRPEDGGRVGAVEEELVRRLVRSVAQSEANVERRDNA